MLMTSDEPSTQARLRNNAELKIRGGVAPDTQGWTIGTSALSLLHSLASNPTTASDALKLLHELQVHQVELDLQHEQMEESRQELEESARHYGELYDFAPAAHFSVDNAGRIVEGNFAAARMLGIEREELGGRHIDSLVMPSSRPSLATLLEQVAGTRLQQNRTFRGADPAGTSWLAMVASVLPRGLHCLLVVVKVSEADLADEIT